VTPHFARQIMSTLCCAAAAAGFASAQTAPVPPPPVITAENYSTLLGGPTLINLDKSAASVADANAAIAAQIHMPDMLNPPDRGRRCLPRKLR